MSLNSYLIGNMSSFMAAGEYHKATEWREYCKQRLIDVGIKVFDPTFNSIEHFKNPPELDCGVIMQNYTYLKKCDLAIVNLEKLEESIGSLWEVTICWEYKKPVIAFGECKLFANRPHFKSMMPIVLPDRESACDYVLSIYNQTL